MKFPNEKIISNDGIIQLGLQQLMQIYKSLKIERFPKQNLHDRNWNDQVRQYVPQVQDPVISLSSKSLVLGINSWQICKIRIDGKTDSEIQSIEIIKNKTELFPKIHFIVDLPFGLKGVIMERVMIFNKYNFTAGELNRFYYNFVDELNILHEQGIIHNDLGKDRSSQIRPNIVISNDRIRLLDFESVVFKTNAPNWNVLLENEKMEVRSYFYELINFACNTLT